MKVTWFYNSRVVVVAVAAAATTAVVVFVAIVPGLNRVPIGQKAKHTVRWREGELKKERGKNHNNSYTNTENPRCVLGGKKQQKKKGQREEKPEDGN